MAIVHGLGAHDFIHVAGDGHVAPSGYTDEPNATNGDDTILPGGGNDIIYAGGGDDIIDFKDHLTVQDQIDGGSGNDTVRVTANATPNSNVSINMVNVENFVMYGGSQSWIISGVNVPSGQTLRVDMLHIDPVGTATVNGAGAIGNLTFISGADTEETMTGGSGNDTFDVTALPADILSLNGGAGDDTVNFYSDPEKTSIFVNGAAGANTLNFRAGLSSEANIVTDLLNFQQVNFFPGFDYTLTVDSSLDPFQFGSLTVNGARLHAGNSMTVLVDDNGVGPLTVIGGAGNDEVSLGPVNHAIASLGAGNDRFVVSTINSGDQFDGGTGTDTLVITSPTDFVLDPSVLHSIEIVSVAAGHSYTLSTTDAFVPAGHSLTIDGSALGAGDVLTFDGSAVTGAHLVLLGGAGADVLTGGSSFDSFVGGAGDDTLNLAAGGNDTADGDAGNDTFIMGAALTAADRLDGGSGNDTVVLDGNYSLALQGATMTGIETLRMEGGFSYAISLNEGNVAAGHTLTIDASDLGAADVLHIDLSQDTDGRFVVIGGAGNDLIFGGGTQDVITGGLGADRVEIVGPTELVYNSVADSTSTGHDTLFDFGAAGRETIHLPFVPTGTDPTVSTGTLSHSTFDADLAAAIGAGQMAVHHAVFFEPNAGSLAGHTFLIVDANGVAGYQAGQDYVIEFGSGSVASATFV